MQYDNVYIQWQYQYSDDKWPMCVLMCIGNIAMH